MAAARLRSGLSLKRSETCLPALSDEVSAVRLSGADVTDGFIKPTNGASCKNNNNKEFKKTCSAVCLFGGTSLSEQIKVRPDFLSFLAHFTVWDVLENKNYFKGTYNNLVTVTVRLSVLMLQCFKPPEMTTASIFVIFISVNKQK